MHVVPGDTRLGSLSLYGCRCGPAARRGRQILNRRTHRLRPLTLETSVEAAILIILAAKKIVILIYALDECSAHFGVRLPMHNDGGQAGRVCSRRSPRR